MRDTWGIATHPVSASYRTVATAADMPQSIINSVIVTTGAVVGLWLVGAMAAYACTLLRFRLGTSFCS